MKKFFTILLAVLVSATLFPVSVSASLYQYYQEQGLSLPSVQDRAEVAASVAIWDYVGSRDQNIELERRLRDRDRISSDPELIGFSVVTNYKTTLASSMSSVATTIPVSTLSTKDGHTLTMSDLGGVVYLTVEPGSSKEEIFKCTAIVSSQWANCTGGLAFYGTTETSVAANRKTHNAGSVVIISDVHYVFEQLVDKDSSEDIAGYKTFVSSSIYLGDDTTSANKVLYANNGETNEPFFRYNESLNKWEASDDGVNTVTIASSSASGLSASSTAGTGIINSEIYIKPSSTLGMTFDSDGNLYQNVSSTKGLACNSEGCYIKAGDFISFDSSGNLIVDATSTRTANKVAVSDANGELDDWVGYGVFGQATDGDVTLSASTTLTRDMYYDNLTIETGVVLNPDGFKIFVADTLTFEGTGKIALNGNNGGNGANGGTDGGAGGGGAGGSAAAAVGTSGSLPPGEDGKAGGAGGGGDNASLNDRTAGTAGGAGDGVSKSDGSAGVAGAAGGASTASGGSAGAAGAKSGTVYNVPTSSIFNARMIADISGGSVTAHTGSGGTGGSGGGGGGQGSGGDVGGDGGGGGGAGSSGGFIMVFARYIVTVNGNNYIESIGGNGGNGGNGGSAPVDGNGGGGGGAGSGGSGGVVILVYKEKTGTGTISVAGGSAGSAGAGGSGAGGGSNGNNGGAGTAGNTGQTYLLDI